MAQQGDEGVVDGDMVPRRAIGKAQVGLAYVHDDAGGGDVVQNEMVSMLQMPRLMYLAGS